MRRGAVIAVGRVALVAMALALTLTAPGCAGLQRPKARAAALAWRSSQCQLLSQKAQAAIDRHDEPEAVRLLTELVVLEPGSAEAHQRLGRVLQAQGRLAEAESEYRRALEFDHEYVAALTALGAIEETQGRPDLALKQFDDAIDLDPNQAEALKRYSPWRRHEKRGRFDEALAAYFRALEFAPNSAEARLRVATLQLARDEPDQALARLDALVEQDPDNAEARHQRGRARLVLHQVPQALDDLKLAATRLPKNPEVHYHLALALAADHKTKAALESAQRALALAPNYPEALDLTQKLRR